MKHVLSVLPGHIGEKISSITNTTQLYEIRLSVGQPLLLSAADDPFLVCKDIICNENDIIYVLKMAAGHALYSYTDEIRQGFITIKGGHRIGLCGRAVYRDKEISFIENYCSINIRIACRQIRYNKNLDKIVRKDPFIDTLIIGPPGCGKTTMIKQICETLSHQYKVAVVDERDELIGDYGPGAFIYSRYTKWDAAIQSIRSMAPRFIVFDEIGGECDKEAIINCSKAGCTVYATMHCNTNVSVNNISWQGRVLLVKEDFGIGEL